MILDQTRLSREAGMLRLALAEDAAHAIRVMRVHGARHAQVIETLAATRPTAVDLHWAPVVVQAGPAMEMFRAKMTENRR